MPRDPKYDILFEPIRIGPKTMRNRFYQTPHCSGLGGEFPGAQAGLRGMKAEGGWGVRQHRVLLDPPRERRPALDSLPRLWDETDVRNLGLMTEQGARARLAGRGRAPLRRRQPHGRRDALAEPGVSQVSSEAFWMRCCYEMDRRRHPRAAGVLRRGGAAGTARRLRRDRSCTAQRRARSRSSS